MNESRSQMRAEIIQLLQELNVDSVENGSESNDFVCDNKCSISDIQILIKSLDNRINKIQSGRKCCTNELKAIEAIIQKL